MTVDTRESGYITEITHRDGGIVVWFQGDQDDPEFGVSIWDEDLYVTPEVDQYIVVGGHGNPNGLNYLEIAGEILFDRTTEEVALLRARHVRENQIDLIEEKLAELRKND